MFEILNLTSEKGSFFETGNYHLWVNQHVQIYTINISEKDICLVMCYSATYQLLSFRHFLVVVSTTIQTSTTIYAKGQTAKLIIDNFR